MLIDIGSCQDKYFNTLRYNYNQFNLNIQNVFERKGIEYYTQSNDIRGEVLPIDHYRVFSGELVLDIEHNSLDMPTHDIIELTNNIILYSKDKLKIEPYAFISGGSGVHIHYYTKSLLEKEILYYFLNKAFDLETLERKEILDTHLLSGTHQIRAPGGRKLVNSKTYYKSYIPKGFLGRYVKVISRNKINMPKLGRLRLWEHNNAQLSLSKEKMTDILLNGTLG